MGKKVCVEGEEMVMASDLHLAQITWPTTMVRNDLLLFPTTVSNSVGQARLPTVANFPLFLSFQGLPKL